MLLENTPNELRGDGEVVMEAVKQNGDALQNSSEELKGDREVVMEAVERNRRALEFEINDLH